jgi:hypothetical protein
VKEEQRPARANLDNVGFDTCDNATGAHKWGRRPPLHSSSTVSLFVIAALNDDALLQMGQARRATSTFTRSVDPDAAIDVEDLAGDPAGLLTRQMRHGVRNLFWSPVYRSVQARRR